ncbi:uncharacterized mitochondrial protein AtMg00820-like [Dioscorea cayenensis subsp. rotundata]|uniref:Uncharacterized mitochondrial protein AtMg00820-like n=1 Tax=Dioscorea cayennensis subsp. rotundata TaxID=55577 RepID=A0AB40AUS9_DIOCR|nr:uncharacterized mitochondrial protein AtMg00820-like [Dioscorea cayenensis subsp. rotundata]
MVERQSGNQLRILRTDGGEEFMSKEFQDFYDQKDSGKVLISRDVRFVETEFWQWTVMDDQTSKMIVLQGRKSDSIAETQETRNQSESSTGVDRNNGNVRALKDLYESCSFALNVTDPSCYKEAEKSDHWRQAMSVEIDAIQKNNTWKLCELPVGNKAIGVKWIYKTKLKPNFEIDKYKARLVAKGYAQEFGIDYE